MHDTWGALPSNDELASAARTSEDAVATLLLSRLLERLDLDAASVLFADEESGIYSPIFVYPPKRKQSQYVELLYKSTSIDRFRELRTIQTIRKLKASRFYSQADILIEPGDDLVLFAAPVTYFSEYLGILNCYRRLSKSTEDLSDEEAGLIRAAAEKLG